MVRRYKTKKEKRKVRTRGKIRKNLGRPRLSVFRSNKYIYAQIINDQKGETLVACSDFDLGKKEKTALEKQKRAGGTKKTKIARLVGNKLAKKALKKGIKKVVFDRGGYKYHGRVKALAQGAREGGLIF